MVIFGVSITKVIQYWLQNWFLYIIMPSFIGVSVCLEKNLCKFKCLSIFSHPPTKPNGCPLGSILKVMDIRPKEHVFPFCVVWTPIPLISWFFPFIGHMGIATSRGIIRDFAGSYYVSENCMAFGWPTSYWQLSPSKVNGGVNAYDKAIEQASEEYKSHIHNLFCDNCHSHVALALNSMRYNGRSDWNMVNLCAHMLFEGHRVNYGAFLKQYLPYGIWLIAVVCIGYLYWENKI